MGHGRIPAVLCIDVEPDERVVPVPGGDRWGGFEALLSRLPWLRARLEDATGTRAQLVWFLRMDPQVEVAHGTPGWVADRYGAELDRLRDAGDELGVHPHSWRWVDGGWVSDQADGDWVAHCACTSLDAFGAAFGHPCRAYRHGDRFMDDGLLRVLAQHGVEVDLTLEPGMPATSGLGSGEATTGTIPAVSTGAHPPHRSPLPEASGLLHLPLTSAPTLVREDPDGFVAHETLTLWTEPRLFAARLAARLEGPEVAHLAFAIRTDLPLHGREWAYLEHNLANLEAVLGSSIEWVTASAARDRLVAQAPQVPAAAVRAQVVTRYAGELEGALIAVETELADERERHAAHTAEAEAELSALAGRLEAAEAQLAVTARELVGVRSDLEAVRATRTWRLHDRLLPVIRPAASLVRRSSGWLRLRRSPG